MSENQNQSNTGSGPEALAAGNSQNYRPYVRWARWLADLALAADAPVEYIVIGSSPGGGPLAVDLASGRCRDHPR